LAISGGAGMYQLFKMILILGILGTAIYLWITDPVFFTKYRKYLLGAAAIELLIILSLLNDYIYRSKSAKSREKSEEARRKTMSYKKK
jgi:hypothetical protein